MTSENDFASPRSATSPFQSLALTGGGYRGLFTAKVLQVIEDALQEPIGRRFDLICGTSIGGIVALAVAFEVPMKKVVEVIEREGPNIFPGHPHSQSGWAKALDFFRYRNRPRYFTRPLRSAIESLIDKDAILGDALHPVLIPAVNLTQGRPQVFKTRHRVEWLRDWRYKAVEIALATSAAPTFFELAQLEGHMYADGGLFANAPDMLAIHEAEHFLGIPVDCQRILSVGTTSHNYAVASAAGRQWGTIDWMQEQRLFEVIIGSQQQFLIQHVQHRLGSRYLRIDHEPSQAQAAELGLDVATPAAAATLKALATKCATDLLGVALQPYLSHQPQLQLLKHTEAPRAPGRIA